MTDKKWYYKGEEVLPLVMAKGAKSFKIRVIRTEAEFWVKGQDLEYRVSPEMES